jgi:hypothetical protein
LFNTRQKEEFLRFLENRFSKEFQARSNDWKDFRATLTVEDIEMAEKLQSFREKN